MYTVDICAKLSSYNAIVCTLLLSKNSKTLTQLSFIEKNGESAGISFNAFGSTALLLIDILLIACPCVSMGK